MDREQEIPDAEPVSMSSIAENGLNDCGSIDTVSGPKVAWGILHV